MNMRTITLVEIDWSAASAFHNANVDDEGLMPSRPMVELSRSVSS